MKEDPEQPLNPEEASSGIPHRLQQVGITWTFTLASLFLLLDFITLHVLLSGPTTWLSIHFAMLNNFFGTLQGWLWLQGFVVLGHWLLSVGATGMGLAGCGLKVLASACFCLQPMSGIDGFRLGAGFWWSNLAGILFFHAGNTLSVVDFAMSPPPGTDKEAGWLYPGNLPVTGMWFYWFATWVLIPANFLATEWGGDGASWVDGNGAAVQSLQYVGALLLLGGSVVYGVWCDALNLRRW